MYTELFTWVFQALILSACIYGFLRFLRTTRGSGLMRGLVMTLLLGLVALAGLAKALNLAELEKLIESFTPSIAVIMVILFQPELRRIISHVGEQNRLGRLRRKGQNETVNEVVQGVSAMASQNVGALIAFEREFALDEYTHNAVSLDSKVNRLTLESIFHPGSSLHDGAVVIRGDRIVAAACLFPLTENAEISKSTGTRHRAALGLTDETDAVTVIVSEETGQISICRRGRMENDLSPQGLEKLLRGKFGLAAADPDSSSRGQTIFQAIKRALTADIPRKLSALAAGALLVFIAHQEITQTQSFSVQIRTAADQATKPQGSWILVRVPSDDYLVVSPEADRLLDIVVTGSPTALARLKGSLQGVIDVTADMVDNPTDLRIEMIRGNWDNVLGLDVEWNTSTTPRLAVEQLVRQTFSLTSAHLQIDSEKLDPNHQILFEQVEFTPDIVTVMSPSDPEFALGTEESPLLLEEIVIDAEARSTREYRVRLHPSLTEAGYSIENDLKVDVTVPIAPFEQEIGTIEQDIAISVLKGSPEAAGRWQLPARSESARFRIITRGILPTELERGSPAWLERTSAVRKFIEENVRVFVDLSALADGVGNEVPVEWKWRRRWGESTLDSSESSSTEAGSLELKLESDERILLGTDESSESSNGNDPNSREGH